MSMTDTLTDLLLPTAPPDRTHDTPSPATGRVKRAEIETLLEQELETIEPIAE